VAYRFDLADVRFLTGPDAAAVLAAAAALPLTDDSLLADLGRLRTVVGERTAAVVETVRLRRRAIGKLGAAAEGWLFTDEALQQATPAPVARHRAARLVGVGVHDVTCSIGADLVALAGVGPAVGSDLDEVRVLVCLGGPFRVSEIAAEGAKFPFLGREIETLERMVAAQLRLATAA